MVRSGAIGAHETGHYFSLRHNQPGEGMDDYDPEPNYLMLSGSWAIKLATPLANHLRRDQILLLRKSLVFEGQ